jgi:hypothetical protein
MWDSIALAGSLNSEPTDQPRLRGYPTDSLGASAPSEPSLLRA